MPSFPDGVEPKRSISEINRMAIQDAPNLINIAQHLAGAIHSEYR